MARARSWPGGASEAPIDSLLSLSTVWIVGFFTVIYLRVFCYCDFFFFLKPLPKLGSSGQYSYEWSNRWSIFIVSVSAGGTKDGREVEVERDGGLKKTQLECNLQQD